MKSQAPALYIPCSQLLPGQTRYSSKAVQAKVQKYIKRGDAEWNEQHKRWEGRFHEGKSIFSLENAIPVIRGPQGFVLIDGHHDVLASIYFDMTFVPIIIIDDLSNFDTNTFWPEAERQGWVYLTTLVKSKHGIKIQHISQPPANFSELIDDPVRYFASTTARKFSKCNDPLHHSQGAEYPLWIKIGKDTPFIEFALADMLYKHRFVYNYADGSGDSIPESLVEQARDILISNPVAGLRLLSERCHYLQINPDCLSC